MMRDNSAHTIQILKLCVIAPMLLFMQLVYTSELREAIERNDLARVETCLTGHPDLSKAVDANGSTVLQYAIRNEKITNLLVNFGADPKIANKSIKSPLYIVLRRPETTSGHIPSYQSRGDEVRNLLKCTKQSFEQACDGKVEELMQALKRFDENTLLAVCGARNEENLTLDQVLDREGHANEAGVVRKMLDDPKEGRI